MIDLKNNMIVIGKQSNGISRFSIWWTVQGLGLFTTLQEAIEKSKGQPILTTPVAEGYDGLYEILPPEMSIDLESRDYPS